MFLIVVACAPSHEQNPPAVPTLFVCWAWALLSWSRLAIDWHNYAHSVLALALPRTHLLVRLSTLYNNAFARCPFACAVVRLLRLLVLITYAL